MSKIFLIRHGQASFHADDYDQLSDLGIEQAKLVGRYLANKTITPDLVITGSMLRHQQTAQHSLDTFGLADDALISLTEQDVGWNEYDHQNILGVYHPEFTSPSKMRAFLAQEPDPLAAFQQHFFGAMQQWIQASATAKHNDSGPYTESWAEFQQRVIGVFERLTSEHHGKTILVYSSGGPISVIASLLLGLPLTQFVDINWSLVNGGVTKVVARGQDKQWSLSSLNEHDIFEQQGDKRIITYT
ncbi:histidine phosphatase family protein [Shewanella sp. 10N.286.48.A6]|uniref:histidine phosphatase family protein n=1 Tax=Shewanella sp. 10N.286.48.A6 TaxID=1880833 RepID=UPI000C8684C8|nr:histidine phosphatase family protein [Shewanella sp. 10N.286.48.A6]PMI01922.1 hypothetical protein BCU55_09340 [Shewanella sp. 10N.286.48.A6]